MTERFAVQLQILVDRAALDEANRRAAAGYGLAYDLDVDEWDPDTLARAIADEVATIVDVDDVAAR
jgi:hypothetical protein